MIQLKDELLPRLCGRGYSDQANVPQELHDEAVKFMLNIAKQKYSDDFAEVSFKGVEGDLLITVYRK